VIAVIAALPPALIKTVAGLALVGAFSGAVGSAFGDDTKRFPAILTFAVTASGLAMAGIGSAFWGLAAGLLALATDRAALLIRARSGDGIPSKTKQKGLR
jgi:benzoate membrane transport protein